MRHFPKEKALPICVVAILVFLAFMLLTTMNTITNVSAVVANGVEVYWDSDCTDPVSFIDWGTVTPGSEHKCTVFIRNKENSSVTLFMNTLDWNPSKASEYITLSWNYNGQAVDSGEAIRVTLTLSISRSISEITDFNFKIIIGTGIKKSPDLNGDGIVDLYDLVIVALRYGAEKGKPPPPNTKPYHIYADLNFDNIIDLYDIVKIGINYGETW